MLYVQAEQLREITQAIFKAVGSMDDVATYMAGSLVENNLMGHDSHGVIRVPAYVERIEAGQIRPAATPQVIKETRTTAVVKGNWAFGQVSAKYATQLVIDKAAEMNIASAAVVECNHIGRLGEYAEMIAANRMFGMVVSGGATAQFRGVAPYGGAKGALGTNPYAFAMPAGEQKPFIADFATSVVAEGKLQVARAKGIPLPEGAILDKAGQPTTDANEYYNGGVLLPFGGHKGYSFSLLADLLGALLAGSEVVGKPPYTAGTFLMALRIDAFRPFAEFAEAVDKRFAEIKAVPPAPGFDEVLIPGEPEARAKKKRLEEGIPVPEDTWGKITAVARKLRVVVEPAH